MIISDVEAIVIVIFIVLLAGYIALNLRQEDRKVFHYLYSAMSLLMIVWLAGVLGMRYTPLGDMDALYILDSITNIGSMFSPPIVLLVSIVYTRNLVYMERKMLLLFVVPLISIAMVWTNPWHHLFYTNFSILASEVRFGPYMYVNAVYSYGCMMAGAILMIRSTRTNSSSYRGQAILFALGTMVPVILNSLITLKAVDMSIAATPISFVVTIALHGIAIYKYKFLNVMPIALESIVDHMSEGFLVVNGKMMVVDYNAPLVKMFGSLYRIRRRVRLAHIVAEAPHAVEGANKLIAWMRQTQESGKEYTREVSFVIRGSKKYYQLQISPITMQGTQVGMVVLLRDTTQSKLDMQRIAQNQSVLMERERLASLGQLIGGITHNLKTPIMALSGSILALEELIGEYKTSVGDDTVSQDDHHEIAEEMQSWVVKMKPYCTYMSDIISAVKDQAVQMNVSSQHEFMLDELIKRIELLMKHELKKAHCQLIVSNHAGERLVIRGDVNNLVQVFDNLIINAIEAYEPLGGGEIRLAADRQGQNILFCVSDQAGGIPPNIEEHLFKEMYTSKGAKGTGLGLYMAQVAIKGRFGGAMWLETEWGKGARFYIRIPLPGQENIA